jgi:hypothetical protein
MNRRNVLKGLSAASIGSMGLAFGSGAFTETTATRDFTVSLSDSDRDSQLVIEETDLGSAAIKSPENGQFEIDAQRIAPNAITTYGRFGDITDPSTLEKGAFVIRNENNTGYPVDITVSISFEDDTAAALTLALEHPEDESNLDGPKVLETSAGEDDDAVLGEIPSTESVPEDDPNVGIGGKDKEDAEIQCGFIIDTTEDVSDTILGITLDVTADRVSPPSGGDG